MVTHSGSLTIKESTLECLDASGMVRWSLPVHSIVLVAEYTTNEGPHLDDYFLVFVTTEDGKLYFSTCSFYLAGIDDVLSTLQGLLGSPIRLELEGSTQWRSRVAWPPEMEGREYFTFLPVRTETLAEKVKEKLLGPFHQYGISKDVQEYLRVKSVTRNPVVPGAF